MDYIGQGLVEALKIIIGGNAEFIGTVAVSLFIATSSTTLAAITGIPFGIIVGHSKFRGRNTVLTILNTLMSLPTVVIGLIVYSFISHRGPLGELNILYTRGAIIIGQWILAFPIIAGLCASAIAGIDKRIHMTALSLGADSTQGFRVFLHESRFAIIAAVVAGFGRVFAEVGISMMLGGNIRGYTRTITTSIVLETSKGEFAMGIALGLVLLTIALVINILFGFLRRKSE